MGSHFSTRKKNVSNKSKISKSPSNLQRYTIQQKKLKPIEYIAGEVVIIGDMAYHKSMVPPGLIESYKEELRKQEEQEKFIHLENETVTPSGHYKADQVQEYSKSDDENDVSNPLLSKYKGESSRRLLSARLANEFSTELLKTPKEKDIIDTIFTDDLNVNHSFEASPLPPSFVRSNTEELNVNIQNFESDIVQENEVNQEKDQHVNNEEENNEKHEENEEIDISYLSNHIESPSKNNYDNHLELDLKLNNTEPKVINDRDELDKTENKIFDSITIDQIQEFDSLHTITQETNEGSIIDNSTHNSIHKLTDSTNSFHKANSNKNIELTDLAFTQSTPILKFGDNDKSAASLLLFERKESPRSIKSNSSSSSSSTSSRRTSTSSTNSMNKYLIMDVENSDLNIVEVNS